MQSISKEFIEQFAQIEEELTQTSNQLQQCEEQIQQLNTSIQALQELPNMHINSSLLVPLAHGIRIHTTLQKNDTVMVHVGSNTAVEKTPQQAQELVQEQLIAVTQYAQKLEKKIETLSALADEIHQQALQQQ